jgi:hypothetical protein
MRSTEARLENEVAARMMTSSPSAMIVWFAMTTL